MAMSSALWIPRPVAKGKGYTGLFCDAFSLAQIDPDLLRQAPSITELVLNPTELVSKPWERLVQSLRRSYNAKLRPSIYLSRI
jgi:hypothetical protein